MQAGEIQALFAEVTAELVATLANLDRWDETGERRPEDNTQYHHDVVADRLVVGRLLGAGLSVLSEESGRQGDGEVLVVVDPIDGSTNAARGLPWYATSLCAVDAEGPWVGHVANLATGDVYTAVRGEGAKGPGGVLKPSGCERLSDAIVALAGPPAGHGGWSQFRVYGAAALDICAVAAGTFDGYVDPLSAHAPWDYLAAMLICREAGGVVTELSGRSLDVVDPTARLAPVAAATPALAAGLVTMARRW